MSVAPYLRSDRETALFGRLVERFDRFTASLPSPLRELSARQASYHGDEIKEPFRGLHTLNPILVGAPWLFWEPFEGIPDDRLLDIAEAGMWRVLASVVLDHLVDGQSQQPGPSALFHQALFEQARGNYQAIFPADSDFWSAYQRLSDLHRDGLACEVHVRDNPSEFNRQTLDLIARGKAAPIAITLAALSESSGRPARQGRLESSLNQIAVASQVLDDIGDWALDVEKRHLSYFLARLLPPEAYGPNPWPGVDEVGLAIHESWADVQLMKWVLVLLDAALDEVDAVHCPRWKEYVQGYRNLANMHLDRFIRAHLARTFEGMRSLTTGLRDVPVDTNIFGDVERR